jgi:hypothetical protein
LPDGLGCARGARGQIAGFKGVEHRRVDVFLGELGLGWGQRIADQNNGESQYDAGKKCRDLTIFRQTRTQASAQTLRTWAFRVAAGADALAGFGRAAG